MEWITEVRFQAGIRYFSSPPRPYPLCGPHSLISNGKNGLRLWDKAAAGWSITHLLSNGEVKDEWRITSISPVRLHCVAFS